MNSPTKLDSISQALPPKLIDIFALLAVAIFAAFVYQVQLAYNISRKLVEINPSEILSQPVTLERYSPPTIEARPAYTILLVGDSMTAALGPNSDSLRRQLEETYPNKTFGLFNYGVSASNILSLPERLRQPTDSVQGQQPPILDREYEVIVIESFAHNPLSDLPLTEGLEKQKQVLDQVVAELAYYRHDSLIVFMTPIAPSKEYYAFQSRDLTSEERAEWANERIAYIKNHQRYAQEHNIPLVDVYTASLDSTGDLDLRYVDRNDYIHPSAEGVELMSRLLTEYLQGVLPK